MPCFPPVPPNDTTATTTNTTNSVLSDFISDQLSATIDHSVKRHVYVDFCWPFALAFLLVANVIGTCHQAGLIALREPNSVCGVGFSLNSEHSLERKEKTTAKCQRLRKQQHSVKDIGKNANVKETHRIGKKRKRQRETMLSSCANNRLFSLGLPLGNGVLNLERVDEIGRQDDRRVNRRRHIALGETSE